MQRYDDFYEVLQLKDDERKRLDSWVASMKETASNEGSDVGDIQVSIVYSCLGGIEIQARAISMPDSDENPFVVRGALDW
ncbi:MAG: hypothetical protein C0623_04720 [Desulfuromonas sp.]|nr:MAG: hypothetical protein C0623_04720 [Desulfuromonas sp.]